jgi:hypothetical protein
MACYLVVQTVKEQQKKWQQLNASDFTLLASI